MEERATPLGQPGSGGGIMYSTAESTLTSVLRLGPKSELLKGTGVPGMLRNCPGHLSLEGDHHRDGGHLLLWRSPSE